MRHNIALLGFEAIAKNAHQPNLNDSRRYGKSNTLHVAEMQPHVAYY